MNSDHCARPSCSTKAAAWLAYDYEARCAWLDDQPADESERTTRWPMCERHADTLKVPRGWFCVDRRTAPVPGVAAIGGSGTGLDAPEASEGLPATAAPGLEGSSPGQEVPGPATSSGAQTGRGRRSSGRGPQGGAHLTSIL